MSQSDQGNLQQQLVSTSGLENLPPNDLPDTGSVSSVDSGECEPYSSGAMAASLSADTVGKRRDPNGKRELHTVWAEQWLTIQEITDYSKTVPSFTQGDDEQEGTQALRTGESNTEPTPPRKSILGTIPTINIIKHEGYEMIVPCYDAGVQVYFPVNKKPEGAHNRVYITEAVPASGTDVDHPGLIIKTQSKGTLPDNFAETVSFESKSTATELDAYTKKMDAENRNLLNNIAPDGTSRKIIWDSTNWDTDAIAFAYGTVTLNETGSLDLFFGREKPPPVERNDDSLYAVSSASLLTMYKQTPLDNCGSEASTVSSIASYLNLSPDADFKWDVPANLFSKGVLPCHVPSDLDLLSTPNMSACGSSCSVLSVLSSDTGEVSSSVSDADMVREPVCMAQVLADNTYELSLGNRLALLQSLAEPTTACERPPKSVKSQTNVPQYDEENVEVHLCGQTTEDVIAETLAMLHELSNQNKESHELPNQNKGSHELSNQTKEGHGDVSVECKLLTGEDPNDAKGQIHTKDSLINHLESATESNCRKFNKDANAQQKAIDYVQGNASKLGSKSADTTFRPDKKLVEVNRQNPAYRFDPNLLALDDKFIKEGKGNLMKMWERESIQYRKDYETSEPCLTTTLGTTNTASEVRGYQQMPGVGSNQDMPPNQIAKTKKKTVSSRTANEIITVADIGTAAYRRKPAASAIVQNREKRSTFGETSEDNGGTNTSATGQVLLPLKGKKQRRNASFKIFQRRKNLSHELVPEKKPSLKSNPTGDNNLAAKRLIGKAEQVGDTPPARLLSRVDNAQLTVRRAFNRASERLRKWIQRKTHRE